MVDKATAARDLYRRVRELFPEFRPFLSEVDEENSTSILIDLVDSLDHANASPKNRDLMRRLESFQEWAETYPRGDDASNDLVTWYFVSFVEPMLEHDTLYRLAPAITAKESLLLG